MLQAYIPSLIRGHNVIKAIEKDGNSKYISDIEETDSEVLFKFNATNFDKVVDLLKPKTSGCNISPFSSKNLPKNKTYKIPDEELETYKNILSKIPRRELLTLTHSTSNFLKTLVTRRFKWEDIKNEMAAKGLKGKEYIHSIGKWNEYILFLKRNLKIGE